MAKIVSYSEAASIGLHGMLLVARAGETTNVQKIAEITKASKHHVAKVMQRLVKEGFLSSNRGPSGGFTLLMKPEDITLLMIYEAIEGKLKKTSCPNDHPICPLGGCILGTVVSDMSDLFRNHMENSRLSDLI